MGEINPRKRCISCDKPLIAYSGLYLHPEIPCAGLLDYIYFDAIIEDVFLNEKFEKLYGKPTLNDYDRIGLLEEENQLLRDLNLAKQSLLNTPLIRFILKFL